MKDWNIFDITFLHVFREPVFFAKSTGIYEQEINLLFCKMFNNFTEGGKSVEHKLRRASEEDLQNGKWKIMTYGETEVTAGKL